MVKSTSPPPPNIDEAADEPPQISPISDEKSSDISLKDIELEEDDEFAFFLPEIKSPISAKIFAAPLVSFLIAASPIVAEYIASTSAAVLSTAFRLLSSNCCNRIFAWSRASSVSRKPVKRSLQKHLRYVSFALAQNWSIQVAYDSRHWAYPPPILDTSSNIAVAREDAARETPARETFVVLRAGTTAERAARAPTALREMVAALRALRDAVAVATRPTDGVVAERATTPDVRAVAERDNVAIPPSDGAPRLTSRPAARAGATLPAVAEREFCGPIASAEVVAKNAAISAEKRKILFIGLFTFTSLLNAFYHFLDV